MKETDLAQKVVEWLIEQNWTIYQEVEFKGIGGVADIVAVRNGIMWIIETKTAFTLEVLNQASRWPVHYRSVAVPRSKNQRDYRVAKDYYMVGVIEVGDYDVYEKLKPKAYLRNHRQAKIFLSQLTELHKSYAKAGSKSGAHLTPYKMTMIEVRKAIETNPGCTVEFLFGQLGTGHYSSKQSFKGNLLKCLEAFEDWCHIDKSVKPYKLFISKYSQPEMTLPIEHFAHQQS